MSEHASEVSRGERFEFGANWARFLGLLDEGRIQRAQESLQEMLGVHDLEGRSFLDIGSGSGLFSLAARRLGATVHSLDYDPQSVACTRELRRRYFPDDLRWTVEEGSALDADYLASLGTFGIVYSWGVLHHTGDMWKALDLVHARVADGGLLFIALYNDMGPESDRWRRLKKRYCGLPAPLRAPYAVLAMLPYEARTVGRAVLRLRPQEYVHLWTRYRGNRGMSRWRDIIDWVGGYPYEVATADEILRYYSDRGFEPVVVKRNNGLGCNEFVLRRSGSGGHAEGLQARGQQTEQVQ
ncbi:MAG TPA: methyltransferase domain-containing protein [Longimicrobiaceae bacterium]|nr:methyltransferase domain-containing protein [Longimicrobiaceae bacterium]